MAVTLGKLTPKSCLVSIYLDGRHVHSQKINPISSTWSSSERNHTNIFHAFIGTPPIWRKYSKLVWKQGVCNLMDDVSSIGMNELNILLIDIYFSSVLMQ